MNTVLLTTIGNKILCHSLRLKLYSPPKLLCMAALTSLHTKSLRQLSIK